MSGLIISCGFIHWFSTVSGVIGDGLRLFGLRFRARLELQARVLLLEKQLAMYKERGIRPRRARDSERISMVFLTRLISSWREALVVVRPDTVCRWHRRMGSLLWRRRSFRKGRPPLPHEIRRVIGRIHEENPLWSPRRIRDEARLKLGVRVAEATVRKYLGLGGDSGPRSGGQSWATFVSNHARETLACDFLTVWTAGFRVVYVFVLMEIGSRRILHVNVTSAPCTAWVVQQFREAVPCDHRWRFLIHDRDGVFGRVFREAVRAFGIEPLRTPPRAPKANAFVERLNGTLRRECLDHVIAFNERHLLRILREYAAHYNEARPHMALGPGIPDPPPGLPVEPNADRHALPEGFEVVGKPVLGGLHHEYRLERKAA
jgi:transposase InsO family protein